MQKFCYSFIFLPCKPARHENGRDLLPDIPLFHPFV